MTHENKRALDIDDPIFKRTVKGQYDMLSWAFSNKETIKRIKQSLKCHGKYTTKEIIAVLPAICNKCGKRLENSRFFMSHSCNVKET